MNANEFNKKLEEATKMYDRILKDAIELRKDFDTLMEVFK